MIFSNNYRWIVLFGTGLGALGILFILIFVPESPIWLLKTKRVMEAERELQKVAKIKNQTLTREEINKLVKNNQTETNYSA